MPLVATIRAGDIVRDADILHLYKKAGFSRILMGVETTDERHPGEDPQGRDDRDRPPRGPATAPARHPVPGRLCRRLRGGDRP